MKIDFKQWKKVAQDAQHSTFRNNDGHELKVAHKGLHPATRGQMAALPLYNEGGMAEDKALPTSNLPKGYQDASSQALQDPEVTGADVAVAATGAPLMRAAGKVGAAGGRALMADEAGVVKLGKKAGTSAIEQGQAALKETGKVISSGPSSVAKAAQPIGRAVSQSERAASQAAAKKKAAGFTGYAQGGAVQDVDLNEQQPPQEQQIQDIDLNAQQPVQDIDLNNMPQAAAPTAAPDMQDVDLDRMPASDPSAAAPQPTPNPSVPPPAPAPTRDSVVKGMAGYLQGDPSGIQIAGADLPAAQAAAPKATDPADAFYDQQIKTMTGALGSEMSGMRAEGAAMTRLGNEQAALQHEQQKIAVAAQADYNQHFQQLNTERQNLIEDIRNHHIDPNRFTDNMTTGSRISTAIGLIASGMGSAMAGQENLAAKFLEKQIENDVQAQKAELGAKENLLSANMRQFGNLKDATDVTRLMRADMLAYQMTEAAAKEQGPLAKARLQQAAAELQLKYAPLQVKIAQSKTLMNLTNSLGNSEPTQAQAILHTIDRLDPERGKDLRERYVPGMGIANTPKQQEEVNKTVADAKVVKTGISRLLQIANTPGRSLSPTLRAEASTTAKLLMGSMKDSIGFRTLTDGDQHFLEQIIADPTSVFSMDSAIKSRLETTRKYTDTAVAEKASAAGLKYDPIKQLSPQNQAIAIWAQKHPNDPRSKAALDKLGL